MIALLAMHLLCKFKDLSLSLRTQVKEKKQGMADQFVTIALGRQVDSRACRPVGLAYLESCRQVRH